MIIAIIADKWIRVLKRMYTMDKQNHILHSHTLTVHVRSPKHQLFKTLTYIGDCLKRQPTRVPGAESNLLVKKRTLPNFDFF